MADAPQPTEGDFARLLEALRITIADCQRLYVGSAQVMARADNVASQYPVSLTAYMQDLHRGLLTKIFVEIAQSDWDWSDRELAVAAELFDSLWGARLRGAKLREAVDQVVAESGALSWAALVKPFLEIPELRARRAGVEALIVRLANLIAKCDGNVRPDELRRIEFIQQELRVLFDNIPLSPGEGEAGSQQGPEASRELESAAHDDTQPAARPGRDGDDAPLPMPETLDDLLAEVESLIGLTAIKHEVRGLVNFLKVQAERKKHKLPQTDVSLHMAYSGNPGTGKTTVARLIGRVFGAMGVLKKGHLVETDRSGLVAKYAGQTGPKTHQCIDKALDGVLFIDEAYSLVADDGEDAYGDEAVQALLKRVEDDRDRLVVILAGYPEPLERLLKTNPGLSSRFHRVFHFEDYTASELGRIFQSMCDEHKYRLPWQARLKLLAGFQHLLDNRDERFGNGRLARNVFEQAIRRQANRIAAMPNLTPEVLTSLLAEDIELKGVPEEVLHPSQPVERLHAACPGCQQPVKVAPDWLGKAVRCKKCGVESRLDWGELNPPRVSG